jgi:SAM-dependent methyltransferase
VQGAQTGEHTWPAAGERRRRQLPAHFATLAELFDPTTLRHITELGIRPGWRCWDVGTGGSTVPSWLAEQVGRDGYVVATDRDLTGLGAHDDTFQVRQHDVTTQPPPATDLDLVHARLLVEHLGNPQAVLATMAGALRRGGWLLVEDADPMLQPLACPDATRPAQQLANKLRQASWTLAGRRADLAFGRTLPRLLRTAGLVDVHAEVTMPFGGRGQAQFQKTLVERLREPIVAAGLASDAEIDQHLADLADAQAAPLDLVTWPLVAAWGRKP